MIMVGMIIGGSSGYFGRGNYNDVRVEGVGVDWVVARDIEEDIIVLAQGSDIHLMLEEYIKNA